MAAYESGSVSLQVEVRKKKVAAAFYRGFGFCRRMLFSLPFLILWAWWFFVSVRAVFSAQLSGCEVYCSGQREICGITKLCPYFT